MNKFENQANKFFTAEGKINYNLSLQFADTQEAVSFLVELIRLNTEKKKIFQGDHYIELEDAFSPIRKIFCNHRQFCKENDWYFSFKLESRCPGCRRSREILARIFGEQNNFHKLPFMKTGYDNYNFTYNHLKFFAKYGEEKTEIIIKKINNAREKRRIQRFEFEKNKHARQLDSKLKAILKNGNYSITEELRQQILPYAGNESLRIVDSETAVVVVSRNQWGKRGGIAEFSQIILFHKNLSETREWQWRSQIDESRDTPFLRVNALGEITLSRSQAEVEIEVTLINNKSGERKIKHSFTI